MAIGKRKGGGTAPINEKIPPHQEKEVNVGDDNWMIRGTAVPVADHRFSGNPTDAEAVAAAERRHHPVYNTRDSMFIHEGLKRR